jgi:hypothetical protein
MEREHIFQVFGAFAIRQLVLLSFFFSPRNENHLIRAAHGCKSGVVIIGHGFSELFLRISWVDSPGVQ